MRNNNTIAVIAIVGAVIVAWLVLNTAGDLIGFVIRLLLWMLAGTLAGRLLRGRGYGLLGDILLGLAGGIVGESQATGVLLRHGKGGQALASCRVALDIRLVGSHGLGGGRRAIVRRRDQGQVDVEHPAQHQQAQDHEHQQR